MNFGKMVGRVGLFGASSAFAPGNALPPASLQSCPAPLRGHLRFATMFKFVPYEFVQPTTNGLKERT